jgi:hypothetical protein
MSPLFQEDFTILYLSASFFGFTEPSRRSAWRASGGMDRAKAAPGRWFDHETCRFNMNFTWFKHQKLKV